MLIISAFLIIFLIYLIIRLRQRWIVFGLRDKIGLKGPPAHWFFGSLLDILERQKKNGGLDDSNMWHLELHKKYGDKFGIYFGTNFFINLSDEEDIKEVYIKQFRNFSDRSLAPFFDAGNLSQSMMCLTYENGWKSARNSVLPVFSSGKMKQLFPTIEKKVALMLEILETKVGTKFDIYEDFQALTLDVMAAAAFAVECDCQRNRDDLFYKETREYMRELHFRDTPLIAYTFLLPELQFLWKTIYRFSKTYACEFPIMKALTEVYDRRKAGEASESVDILKMMIDNEGKFKGFGKREILQNSFGFLLAGFETTSISLTYCAYLLSRDLEVQQKLYDEIILTRDSVGLNYDTIHEMKYLDAVYRETLRMYPPVIHLLTRTTLNDTYVRGQLIPKGAIVSIVPHSVHHNEKNWPNSFKFDPERFIDSKEANINSLKWIPFGVGPRNCTGYRFAEMEFKTALARIIEKFEMKFPVDGTDVAPDCNGVIMRPRDPMNIDLKVRDDYVLVK
ncbi:unnamed protein product [Caenorhabditis angaria]|uniref:Cytochrome P450 n=1 Tax=Caenorhabditis angaria TaxID=860376 RepID=A0A9P1N261_9PELO|nr:unnamed protein product [Caenorhabditis angaria]